MTDEIKRIASEIFGLNFDCVDLSMTPDDIDQWDSLNHLRLITAVESAFAVRFTMRQIQAIESLGDISRCVVEPSGCT